MVEYNLDKLTEEEIISDKDISICKDIQRISRVSMRDVSLFPASSSGAPLDRRPLS